MQLGQHLQLVTRFVRSLLPKDKGVMDMWGRGDVPGTASQRTCLESAEVVGEVGGNRFYDFEWERMGRFVRNANGWRRITEQADNLSFASLPNGCHPTREAYPYGTNGGEVGEVFAEWWGNHT